MGTLLGECHQAGPGWALSPGACIGQELKGRGRWSLRIKAARAPQMPGSQAGPGPFIGLAGLQATGLLSGWCQGAHFSSAGKPEGWFDSRSPGRWVPSPICPEWCPVLRPLPGLTAAWPQVPSLSSCSDSPGQGLCLLSCVDRLGPALLLPEKVPMC